ncbi:hypothetical protein WKH31_10345 [Metabacillus indicus]|uniref:hypothetical protein n=1 Tax=Metabacillus indicus TaxID=246786 RepID=UPI00316CB514
MSTNEFQEIPKVELVNFSFSPPGPMGWSAAEYETMLEDPETFLSQNKYRKAEPPTGNLELIELPIKTRKPQEIQVPAEIMKEEALDAAADETVHSDEKEHQMEKEKKKQKKKQAAESITEILDLTPAAAELPVPSEEELPMSLETEMPMQSEEVQPAKKRSLSLNDMLSLYQGSSSSETENQQQQQQQETQFKTKRKSKTRNSPRKNRVLFM